MHQLEIPVQKNMQSTPFHTIINPVHFNIQSQAKTRKITLKAFEF